MRSFGSCGPLYIVARMCIARTQESIYVWQESIPSGPPDTKLLRRSCYPGCGTKPLLIISRQALPCIHRHPPSQFPNLELERAESDKAFLENIWTTQEKYRTKEIPSVVIRSKDQEAESPTGGPMVIASTFHNVSRKTNLMKGFFVLSCDLVLTQSNQAKVVVYILTPCFVPVCTTMGVVIIT